VIWGKKNWAPFSSTRRRLEEDALYSAVLDEISRGEFDLIAQARSLEEAEGERERARALYIRHRIRRIRDIFELEQLEQMKLKASETQEGCELPAAEHKINTSSWTEVRRNQLRICLRAGKPNKEVKRIYQDEFKIWAKKYASKEHSRLFLTESQLWVTFMEFKLAELR